MARVQCRRCKQYFDREKYPEGEYWIKPSNLRYYHTKCWEIEQKMLDDAEAAAKEEATEDYKDLSYKYLKRDVRMSIDWNKYNGQWRNLIEKKGRRPKGIYLTLRYCYDILKLNADKAEGGIGIVDYKYDEASSYWQKRVYEQPEINQKIIDQINQLKETKEVAPIKRKSVKKRGPNYTLGSEDN